MATNSTDNPSQRPPTNPNENMSTAVIGYITLAIIIALILWRFVFAR
jgi:hypothetical protein